jgi:fumarylpyruvate hydrolase
MSYVFQPAAPAAVPVIGGQSSFPVHRIYCVGRNYAEHAVEMGHTGREPPFFFLKPADTALHVPDGEVGTMPYPTQTQNLHHEIELVVALGAGGRDIPVESAADLIWGYAIGLDMTRRDLQNEMKKQGRPWSIGKGFDQAAPIGALKPAGACRIDADTAITLNVNGQPRQRSQIGKLIWSIPEVIAHLSAAWELAPGDLIYTGTPEGVAAVEAGDLLEAEVAGLPSLRLRITAR